MCKELIVDGEVVAELNEHSGTLAFNNTSSAFGRPDVRDVIEGLKAWLATGSFPEPSAPYSEIAKPHI